MFVSGGFSSQLNVENAVITGLLPKELGKMCVCVNNTSLLGTIKYAIQQNNLDAYVNNCTYVDLSTDSDFSDLFVKNMMFR